MATSQCPTPIVSALRNGLEKRFLKELTERLPKAVERALEFNDWLSFHNPQLREALRCYLYGFFSAAVLVSAAALEVRMREVASVERIESYSALVACVFGTAGVAGHDPVLARSLDDLFDFRNKVAHAKADASREQAFNALLVVRGTLERFAQSKGVS